MIANKLKINKSNVEFFIFQKDIVRKNNLINIFQTNLIKKAAK